MKFHPTPLKGLRRIQIEPRSDDRGFFARIFCEREFSDAGVAMQAMQMNNSLNLKAGTFRGLRYQLPPNAETKIIRCLSGAVFDIAVDLRPDSPTYKKWHGVELTAENRLMLYVPAGFAHGYLTLTENTEVLYIVSKPFAAESERGLRYDDPAFGIVLPRAIEAIAPKDRDWPDLSPDYHGTDLLRHLI